MTKPQRIEYRETAPPALPQPLQHPARPPAAHWESHFKHRQKTVTVGPELGYRPGTQVPIYPMNFPYAEGGMGDYICWTAALLWLQRTIPFVEGRVFAPSFFIEFARRAFTGTPWKVFLAERLSDHYEEHSLILGPGINGHQQLLNAVGTHLLDLGFHYYANIGYPATSYPDAYHYPEFDFPASALPRQLRGIRYGVLTPGGTTQTRTVPGPAWNPIADYLLSRGITPVFLGKKQMTPSHAAVFPEGTEYGKGIDLRDQTTVLEAAAIMQHAELTLGLDNGLLHLAACVPSDIIFGYNIAAPSQRRPVRRLAGRIIDITLSKAELACIHCQTNMKQQNFINFRNCFYGDVACLTKLFENNSERWIRACADILDGPAVSVTTEQEYSERDC